MQKDYPMRAESAIENGLRRGFHGLVFRRWVWIARKGVCPAGTLFSASLFLTACNHTAPDTALIPVVAPCVPKNLKPADHYETPESLKALKDGDWLKAVVDDWMARIQRMSVTEPVIEKCAAIP